MKSILRRWWLAVLVAGAFLVTAGAALAGPQPTLSGPELLIAGNGYIGSSLSVSASCNPTGTSTITFTASGPTGSASTVPYQGTFTESGTITIGPQTNTGRTFDGSPTGAVTSFSATFTIDSPTGQVSGSKTLAAAAPSEFNFDNTGVCFDLNGQPFIGLPAAWGHDRHAGITASYQATIVNGSKRYADNGLSYVGLDDMIACTDSTSGCGTASRYGFSETFDSSQHWARPTH